MTPSGDKYGWAVDALVEACRLLNEQRCSDALEVIRQALWTAAGSCSQGAEQCSE
jgi:hypothetical protein